MELPEAILFDLDGVLLDTETLLADAWFETAKVYNCYLSNQKLLELKGRRRKDCAEKVLILDKQINLNKRITHYSTTKNKQSTYIR